MAIGLTVRFMPNAKPSSFISYPLVVIADDIEKIDIYGGERNLHKNIHAPRQPANRSECHWCEECRKVSLRNGVCSDGLPQQSGSTNWEGERGAESIQTAGWSLILLGDNLP